jgi:lysophospholipase L1-like esterase
MDSQTESSSKESHGLEAEVPIILFTPPPVDSEAWDHYCSVISPRPLSPRSNSNSKKYGERVTAIGHELNCLVVDTHKLLGGDKDKSYYGQYLTDGLHLTEEGNRKLFDGIMDAIRIEHKHLLPIEDGDVGVPMEEKLWSELC